MRPTHLNTSRTGPASKSQSGRIMLQKTQKWPEQVSFRNVMTKTNLREELVSIAMRKTIKNVSRRTPELRGMDADICFALARG